MGNILYIKTQGESTMDLILKRDVRKLMADTEGAKFALETLEKDHVNWTSRREEKDIAQLLKRVKQLEFDVSLLMGECFCLSYEYEGEDIEDFHQAYVYMNALFQDLKKARKDLNRAYVYPEEFRELEIDWSRIRKSMGKIQRHLRVGKTLQG
jgi:hypothetical protein